ncbi:MAG: ABC-type transport auxiliary lipoprotein family protein, partial [Rhodomicrobium sp.]
SEEVAFYEYHRWAMDPRQAITQYVEDGLRVRSLFQSVTVHERGSETAYVLSGNIEQLEEVDQGRDVRVVCTMSAQLLDTRTRSVVWSHTESDTVPVEKRDIAGVVGSLSAAARTVADRLLKSMTEELPATIARNGSTTALIHTR